MDRNEKEQTQTKPNKKLRVDHQENGKTLTIHLTGRVDSETALQFQKEVSAYLDGMEQLSIHMEKLAYLSSAGLRVLLKFSKDMCAAGGVMEITDVPPAVMEIFAVTGFDKALTIV